MAGISCITDASGAFSVQLIIQLAMAPFVCFICLLLGSAEGSGLGMVYVCEGWIRSTSLKFWSWNGQCISLFMPHFIWKCLSICLEICLSYFGCSIFFFVLWRRWYGTLKRVVWYFEEGGVVLWRGRCGTLKRAVWYFEEGGVVLWRGWYGTLKRVVWYFEEGGVVLWRGWC